MQNCEVSGRWQTLADRWTGHNLARVRPFYMVHAMMAFAAAGRTAAALHVIDALPRIATDEAASTVPESSLATPVCEALLAFVHGDYAQCVEQLRLVRGIADRCGGSVAQCDVIHLTLTEAALRARKPILARALIAERTARKLVGRLNGLSASAAARVEWQDATSTILPSPVASS